MSNYIKQTTDQHSRGLDAICLAECVWWGEGETLYRNWDHGIYEWRDLCWRLSKYTHHAWEHVREEASKDHWLDIQYGSWDFDTEFCPELVAHVLNDEQVVRDPYIKPADAIVREFVELILAEHAEKEAAEKKRRLIEAQILDRQEEIFMLQNQLEDLSK